VIGYLGSLPDVSVPYVAAFRQGLSEAGFTEGRNVAIEFRYAEGHFERYPALAAELVQHHVAVILVSQLAGLRAAEAASHTIPIVFASVGVAGRFGHLGGNVTGVTTSPELGENTLALISEMVPDPALIAFLVDPSHELAEGVTVARQRAAQKLNRRLLILKASTESEIDAAFRVLAEQRAGALNVVSFPFFERRRDQIVALVERQKIPALYGSRMFALAGGLMSYAASSLDDFRFAGSQYVGKILKGAKATDLPIQESSKFECVLNAKTAQALGFTIPPTVQRRVTEVIE
jgi:putative ABC transport system substrate-binding protein